ncbi:hypothetical protein OH76DRAFT_1480887 [Lentinus brumalis]|uniref:Endonuclease/exonuclease/phosphatase domain-containing protein n=1 Tax=Lentinus brumalis TaxID=2498619 RepID=A0A371DIE3_9APHY|nr:hypothetical protein OH76DRAFT_1480887 [Polyporus brumalis]
MLTKASLLQATEDYDLPVATDDEGTVKGTQGTGVDTRQGQHVANDDESLPSSSPIESWTGSTTDENRPQAEGERESTAASYDTEAMWRASGPAQGAFLFDGHESGPLEEGEVDDHEKVRDASPACDERDEAERREVSRQRIEHFENFLSEQPDSFSSNCMTMRRKRSWTGSLASDERNRSTRRPRRELSEVEKGDGIRLPSINEMVGNPWGNDETGPISRHRFPMPVQMSTPRHAQQSPLINQIYHSGANVSGKAPTPFSTSTVASAVRPRIRGEVAEEWAGTHGSERSALRTESRVSLRSCAMDLDDGEGESLLRSPSLRQARIDRSRRELEELEERRRALQETLREAEDSHPSGAPRWHGGYAPEFLGQRGHNKGRVAGRKAVEDLESRDGQGDDYDEGQGDENGQETPVHVHDRWSAIPNTKAWQHREAQRAIEQARRAGGQMDGQPRAQDRRRREFEPTGGRAAETDWQDDYERDARILNTGLHGRESTPHERDAQDEAMEDGRMEPITESANLWRGPGVGGAIPSVVARDEGVADIPIVVENPADERWTVHFDDPEALLRGQSADFIKIVWWDERPTVMFTVFNYKYTENEEVNRHIENAVTSLTTILTGEKDFCVVPPEPDWSRQLGSGDLPFTWAIRGLSEAGAWEMVKVRAITTKGVTIITYPRTLTNPRWLFALGGFLRPDVEAIKTTVLSVLRSAYMIERLEYLTRSNSMLAHIPEERRVEHILRSLDVKVAITTKGAYAANIYIKPPTDDMDAWREWRDELKACRFNAFICGAGKALRCYWIGSTQNNDPTDGREDEEEGEDDDDGGRQAGSQRAEEERDSQMGTTRKQKKKKNRHERRTAVQVASLNINGFGNLVRDHVDNKWGRLYRVMSENRIGILLLQETHLTDERTASIHTIFAKKLRVLHSANPESPTQREGVAVVLNARYIKTESAEATVIIPGRAIQVKVVCPGGDIKHILCIYAPTSAGIAERCAFFDDVRKHYELNADFPRPNLMAGDFNNVEDSMDRLPVAEGPDRSVLALDELKMTLGLMLADGWRVTYPSMRDYTFHRGTGKMAVFSRLDRIYTDQDTFDGAREWRICEAGVRTDHSMTMVQLTPKHAPIVGEGRPLFPVRLLKDKQLTRDIKQRGMLALQELAALEVAGNRTDHVNPQRILHRFKTDSMKLAREREKAVVPKLLAEIQMRETALRKVKASRDMTEQGKVEEAAALTKQIRQLRQQRLKQQQQYSRATHRLFGDRPTKYWSKLHRACAPRDTINAFEIEGRLGVSGEKLYESDSVRMAEMARAHHINVQKDDPNMKPPNEREEDIRVALNSIESKVSEAEASDLGKEIEYDEVALSLRFAKNGSSPGLDGIPFELWKTLHARHIEDTRFPQRASFDIVRLLRAAFEDVRMHGVDPETSFARGWIAPIYKEKVRRLQSAWPMSHHI